jgi:hypothetical protein
VPLWPAAQPSRAPSPVPSHSTPHASAPQPAVQYTHGPSVHGLSPEALHTGSGQDARTVVHPMPEAMVGPVRALLHPAPRALSAICLQENPNRASPQRSAQLEGSVHFHCIASTACMVDAAFIASTGTLRWGDLCAPSAER